MTLLAMVAGMLLCGGLALAIPAWRPRVVRGRDDEVGGKRKPPAITLDRMALVGFAAVGTLVLTRWPVAAIGVAGATLFATSPTLRKGTPEADVAEALTVWAEMLRDATGTPRGIEGVLVATADSAPPLIRPHVQRLAQRLPYEPLDSALDELSDDLDHPIGDLVVMALRLSAQSGGRQIRAVLDDLATMARDEARMHRRIDVARARPRSDMRAVLFIMGGFVLLFVVGARHYLKPYGTPLGQLMLLAVAAVWGTGVWLMARMGEKHQVSRFLAGVEDDGP